MAKTEKFQCFPIIKTCQTNAKNPKISKNTKKMTRNDEENGANRFNPAKKTNALRPYFFMLY